MKFTEHFRDILTGDDIEIVRTAPQTPNMNDFRRALNEVGEAGALGSLRPVRPIHSRVLTEHPTAIVRASIRKKPGGVSRQQGS